MASAGMAFRCSAMVASGSVGSVMRARGFTSMARSLAAQNFTMPAMSPTMTEGNIAKWNVKEGDSFSTGDILLEIETDKAQMEVEAQDDGVMAKIIQGDGSQSVKVGSRIAVLAEPGDNLSALEIPPEESSAPASPQEDTTSGVSKSESSENMAEAPPTSKPSTTPAYMPKSESASSSLPEATPSKHRYPHYPSVQHLLRQHGLSEEEASKIQASGPRGRLLKGDVLSHLGSIEKTYASELSARVSRLGHLDLSNIKPAAPKEPAKAAEVEPSPSNQAAAALPPSPEPPVTVALPISLEKVQHVQRRVQKVLGISLPLSTFLSRATDIANRDLPPTAKKLGALSSDELFEQILGLDSVSSRSMASFGDYVPEITALPSDPRPAPSSHGSGGSGDVYDILTGSVSTSKAPPLTELDSLSHGHHTNLISVSVLDKAEQRRAQTFLGRVKTILEMEPGRLIL